MNLLTIKQVLFIHDRLIEETGGTHGVRDTGLLEAAVARPRSGYGDTELFPTLHDKAAALMESIIRDHPFVDGNKRTGFAAGGVVLARNGWELSVTPRQGYRFTMSIAVDQSDRSRPEWQHISTWLFEHSRFVSS